MARRSSGSRKANRLRIERQQAEGKRVTFRADAAFAKPEIYEALEERGVDYAIRIPANKNQVYEVRGSVTEADPGGEPRLEAISLEPKGHSL